MNDPDYLIKLEKAIQEKYGDNTVLNPKASWDSEKEEQYLKSIKEISRSEKPREKIEVDGVLIPKKLFTKESERTCPVCETYSFKGRDDMYMAKFKCCYKCYVQHVEGREEKWLTKLTSPRKS